MASISSRVTRSESDDFLGNILPTKQPEKKSSPPRSSGGYSDLPDSRDFEEQVQKCAKAVVQIQVNGKRGTGCLIGGNLLITNHHVIGSPEEAKNSKAGFWFVSKLNFNKSGGAIEWQEFEFDPTNFFYSSPAPDHDENGDLLPADRDHLDFTIVALQNNPYLGKLQEVCLKLIHDTSIKIGCDIRVIQHPDIVENGIRGLLKISSGSVREIKDCIVVHDAPSTHGSSGGAVVDREGNFIALYHQGEGSNDHKRPDKFAVLTSKIVAFLSDKGKLEGLKQKIADSTEALAKLKLPETEETWIDVPTPPQDFTGRDSQLEAIQTNLVDQNRVVVIGLGGVGKSTIVHEFVKRNKVPYKAIQLIKGYNEKTIQDGLLEFAKNRKISGKNEEEKLQNLKSHLKNNPGYLLIFDGVDRKEGFEFLEAFLPSQTKSIVVTTRLAHEGHYLLNCATVPVEEFTLREARDFIKNSTSLSEKADKLAKKLGRLPLALSHACSYIDVHKLDIKTFLEEYQEKQTILFGEDFPKPSKKQTVLTTWSITLGQMSVTTLDLFLCCAYLGPHDIPRDLLKTWFEKFAPDENVNTSINELISYSMMQSDKPNSFRIHELVKQVMRDHKSKEANFTSCVEILSEAMEKFDLKQRMSRKDTRNIMRHTQYLVELFHPKINEATLYDMFFWLGNSYLILEASSIQALTWLFKAAKISIGQKKEYSVLGTLFHVIGKAREAQGEKYYALISYNFAKQYKRKAEMSKENIFNASYQVKGDVLIEEEKCIRVNTKLFGGLDYTSIEATNFAIADVLKTGFNFDLELDKNTQSFNIKTFPNDFLECSNFTIASQLMSSLFEGIGEFSQALEVCDSMIKFAENFKVKFHELELANIYEAIANIQQKQNDFDSAFAYYNIALEIKKRIHKDDQHIELVNIYEAIANVQQKQNDFDSAFANYELSLKIKKKFYEDDQHLSLASTYRAISYMLYNQGKLKNSFNYFIKAFKIEVKLLDFCKNNLKLTTDIKLIFNNLQKTEEQKKMLKNLHSFPMIIPKFNQNTQLVNSEIVLQSIGNILEFSLQCYYNYLKEINMQYEDLEERIRSIEKSYLDNSQTALINNGVLDTFRMLLQNPAKRLIVELRKGTQVLPLVINCKN